MLGDRLPIDPKPLERAPLHEPQRRRGTQAGVALHKGAALPRRRDPFVDDVALDGGRDGVGPVAGDGDGAREAVAATVHALNGQPAPNDAVRVGAVVAVRVEPVRRTVRQVLGRCGLGHPLHPVAGQRVGLHPAVAFGADGLLVGGAWHGHIVEAGAPLRRGQIRREGIPEGS